MQPVKFSRSNFPLFKVYRTHFFMTVLNLSCVIVSAATDTSLMYIHAWVSHAPINYYSLMCIFSHCSIADSLRQWESLGCILVYEWCDQPVWQSSGATISDGLGEHMARIYGHLETSVEDNSLTIDPPCSSPETGRGSRLWPVCDTLCLSCCFGRRFWKDYVWSEETA